jgi:hypothetical protein
MNTLKNLSIGALCAAVLSASTAFAPVLASCGPQEGNRESASYKVLKPIVLGDVTLYPIVRVHAEANAAQWKYISLDEGLKSGEVVVTEAGKARGLVRTRNGGLTGGYESPYSSGDEVNTLVLLNNSRYPLVMLAGEIVTGGKQDRIIAKDRIVPAQSRPLDLSVFCIEPHRWVENSAKFGVAGRGGRKSFMVEPSVRREAMAAKNQQQVWNAVGRSITAARSGNSATPNMGGQGQIMYDMPEAGSSRGLQGGTSSYAQTMAAPQIQDKIDTVAAPALGQQSGMPEILRKEEAVGVVAAIDGHILWADIFASTGLLDAYWGKLVRSYAAESMHEKENQGPKASEEAALRFVSDAINGHETSEGTTGLYLYSEIRGREKANTGFDVHRTLMVQSDERESPQEPDLQIR